MGFVQRLGADPPGPPGEAHSGVAWVEDAVPPRHSSGLAEAAALPSAALPITPAAPPSTGTGDNSEQFLLGPMREVKSALCVIPPHEIWPPIQAIRKTSDKSYIRWMPHINLFFPFYESHHFAKLVPRMAEALKDHAPFDVKLNRFGIFENRKEVVFLKPEDGGRLKMIHNTLSTEVFGLEPPKRKFTAHLSIAKPLLRGEASKLAEALAAAWKPTSFRVENLSLITRSGSSPFKVVAQVPLGRGSL